MKLTILLLMLPFFGLANPTTDNSTESVKPEAVKFGENLKTVSNLLNNKTTTLSNGAASYHLKANSFNIGTAKMNDAFVIAEGGIIKSLSLIFNKANGVQFRDDIIKQYGMPQGDMVDNFEWKAENVQFEIHETETGFTATYQHSNAEPLLAQF